MKTIYVEWNKKQSNGYTSKIVDLNNTEEQSLSYLLYVMKRITCFCFHGQDLIQLKSHSVGLVVLLLHPTSLAFHSKQQLLPSPLLGSSPLGHYFTLYPLSFQLNIKSSPEFTPTELKETTKFTFVKIYFKLIKIFTISNFIKKILHIIEF